MPLRLQSLLRGRRGTMSIAKGTDAHPSVPLASGRFCVAGVGQFPLPRGRMNVLAWAPLLLRGRRGAMSTAKGLDIRPSVPLVPLGLRSFLCGRHGVICIAKGSDKRPGVPLMPLGVRCFYVAGVRQ